MHIEAEDIQKLRQFQKKTGYKFRRISRLYQALIHSSYVNERLDLGLTSNETLEFLGDAVLGLVITEYLYKNFPLFSEGKLSIIKSILVSESVLAELALNLDVGNYIFLGRGENKESARNRPSLLSNALESIIAAVYLDGDLRSGRKFIYKIYHDKFKNIPHMQAEGSYKNRLQQYTQSELGCMPEYSVISEKGPSHKKIYEIKVSFKGEAHGIGKGTSKKSAEQEAAKHALLKLGVEN